MVHPVIYRRIIPLTLLSVAGTLATRPATAWKIFKRLFRSPEIEQKLGALVMAVEPEVAHLHNVYHHLSASTFTKLYELKFPPC